MNIAEIAALKAAATSMNEAHHAIMGMPKNRRDPEMVSLCQSWIEIQPGFMQRLARIEARAGVPDEELPRGETTGPGEGDDGGEPDADAPTVEQLDAGFAQLNERNEALNVFEAQLAVAATETKKRQADLDAEIETFNAHKSAAAEAAEAQAAPVTDATETGDDEGDTTTRLDEGDGTDAAEQPTPARPS